MTARKLALPDLLKLWELNQCDITDKTGQWNRREGSQQTCTHGCLKEDKVAMVDCMKLTDGIGTVGYPCGRT